MAVGRTSPPRAGCPPVSSARGRTDDRADAPLCPSRHFGRRAVSSPFAMLFFSLLSTSRMILRAALAAKRPGPLQQRNTTHTSLRSVDDPGTQPAAWLQRATLRRWRRADAHGILGIPAGRRAPCSNVSPAASRWPQFGPTPNTRSAKIAAHPLEGADASRAVEIRLAVAGVALPRRRGLVGHVDVDGIGRRARRNDTSSAASIRRERTRTGKHRRDCASKKNLSLLDSRLRAGMAMEPCRNETRGAGQTCSQPQSVHNILPAQLVALASCNGDVAIGDPETSKRSAITRSRQREQRAAPSCTLRNGAS